MIYDGERNKLIGTAIFTLTTIAEQKLLQLVNHGIKPSSLILMNLNLYQPAKNYIPPNNSNYSYERKGIIYELFTESETGRDTPVSIQMKYKTRPQVITLKNSYFIDNTEFINIEIESVKIYYSKSKYFHDF